jgi:hypothetical protein
MRNSLLGLVLALSVAAPVASHADTITYNFTLVQQSGQGAFGPDNGQVVGTGSFTLVSTTTTPGLEYKAIDQNNKTPTNYISAIDFMIDDLDFNLADAGSNFGNPDPTKGTNSTDIKFNNVGTLTDILYTSNQAAVGININFNGNGGLNYTFSDGQDHNGSNGKVYATMVSPNAVAQTPEPTSLFLFGTGALALAAFSRKRFA